MKRLSILTKICSLVLAVSLGLSATACTVSETPKKDTSDLMEGVEAKTVPDRETDDRFIGTQANLALKLFNASLQKSDGENVLLSPLSILLALSMSANGADGQTRAEMEKLLGGEIPLEELNEYIHSYISGLPSDESASFKSANSIWMRDDESLSVKEEFLRRNADYYGAQVYKRPFDAAAVEAINAWVKEHTDGLIDKIVDSIDPQTVMFLINALSFDAEWERVYEEPNVLTESFRAESGEKRDVPMMYSTEWTYLDDGDAVGFKKDYKGGRYSFAALLPNEGISLDDYVAGLTGEKLLKTLKNAQETMVFAGLPKFKSEYETSLKTTLSELGMPAAFDVEKADFSKAASSEDGNIFIDEVLHKTTITVDEQGTKAAAVTAVIMEAGSAMIDPVEVILDRPFVYMILDNETNLPIFIGCVKDIV